ncbi:MAG: DUF302 domain-containing protein [Alteromonadaceae bacterium]|nr:DUF302 domain-containing protein [Alteromonadaceae bacterium]
MIARMAIFVGLMTVSLLAGATEGLVSLKSPHSAQETMDRLESIVEDKGLNVFARIDHAAGAESVGQALRPTEVLIFGNPKGGTPFMQCAQSVGIDLPLKALVWEDEAGQVWLGYNDSSYLAQRHGAEECAVVPKLSKALEGMTKAAVAK